jgi:pantetheine-phosphate adenylyltransferase
MEIVEIASKLFDHVVVAPIRNTQKGQPLFSVDERIQMISDSAAHLSNVSVTSLSVLTVDLANRVGAQVIIKGLRVASDAESELQQAQMNRRVAGIETLFIPCSSESSFIASKYVRDFARFGGADRIGATVPEPVLAKLKEKFA